MSNDRQDFGGHLDDDRVGVTVRHHAGQRASSSHPEATRVVDYDQVCAADLDELGREARSRPSPNNRLA